MEELFSPDEIKIQVQKIVRDPVFENSTILKNFLQYIVEESLRGNSNKLKEYTIAINVLNKPSDFNTQENGIVRIHAARLRRILDVYYKDHGVIDFIKISIPKGTYIPLFSKNSKEHPLDIHPQQKEPIVVGIIPFSPLFSNETEFAVLKGIELQLATALMKFDNLFVVGFEIISAMLKKDNDLTNLINEYGLNYLIMGEANAVKKNLRLYVHLIKANTSQQVWAHMYERKVISSNHFEIQDELVQLILHQLEEFFE
jgi:TolB-like protein